MAAQVDMLAGTRHSLLESCADLIRESAAQRQLAKAAHVDTDSATGPHEKDKRREFAQSNQTHRAYFCCPATALSLRLISISMDDIHPFHIVRQAANRSKEPSLVTAP